MKSSLTSKWIVDAALLLGFCAAVLLDLTGLSLHQWIGVGVGLLAVYHLLTHLDWVTAVTRRFFGKTSPRSRLYYLIDALILGGFVLIGVTGLLISTWLNLTLDGMAALAAIHKWTAYLTLAALLVKVVLHWRWIVNVAGKFFEAPAERQKNAGFPAAAHSTSSTSPARPTRGYTRREFLKLMGAGALSTVAVAGVTRALDALQASEDGTTGAPAAAGSSTSTTVTTNTGSTSTGVSAASLVCTHCQRGKHCSFPGDCHNYLDTNGNNLCDYGECA